MTEAVAGVIWEIVGYEALSAAAVNAIAAGVVFVGSTALSYAVGQALAPSEPDGGSFKSKAESQLQTRIDPIATWKLVYGRVRKGGTLVFHHVTSTLDRIDVDETGVVSYRNGSYSYTVARSGLFEVSRVAIVVDGGLSPDIVLTDTGTAGESSYAREGNLFRLDAMYEGAPVRINYAVTSGPVGGKFYHMIIALAAHECDAIETLYADDEEVPLDANGNAIGKYYGYLFCRKHLGNAGDPADPFLIASAPDKWTAAHRLEGHCYIYVRLYRGDAIYPWVNGVPNFTAVLRGKKDIYDPRSGSAGWTDNAALCVADYPASPLGLNAPIATQHGLDELIAAANDCDEDVPLAGGGTEKRYTCNGVVDTGQMPRQIIRDMKSSMAGDVLRVGGLWKVYAGVYRPHTLTLTQSDIVGQIKTSALIGRREAFNGVKGVYVSPANKWAPADFPPVKSDVFMAQDGGERIWRDIELPFTTSASMAQRLAKIDLLSARQQLSHVMPLKLPAFRREPPDTIGLTLPILGYSDKAFRINEMSLNVSAEGVVVEVTLRETDSSIFDWSTSEEQAVDPAPNTTLPNPFLVLPPGQPVVTEVIYESNNFGLRSKAALAWGASADGQARTYDVQWQRQGDTVWLEHTGLTVLNDEVLDVDAGTWVFRVAALNAIGVRSVWAQTVATFIGLQAPPADVVNFTVIKQGGLADARWDRAVDLDVLMGGALVVRHSSVASPTWENGVVFGEFAGQAISGFLPLVTGTYMAKWRDSGGRYSTGVASFVVTEGMVSGFTVVATSTQHSGFSGTKTGITLDGGLGGIRLTTVPASGEYLFDATMDLTTVATRRFEADIVSLVYDLGLDFDSHAGDFDDGGDYEGVDTNDCNAVLYARTTNDNPASSPVWSAWAPFVVADFTCRAVQFKLVLTSASEAANILISQLSVQAKVPT